MISRSSYLHGDLREVRDTMVWRMEGLDEYDVRRPLSSTGTDLLGLIKHLSSRFRSDGSGVFRSA